MTAKIFHGFIVRILALALALVGAMLLSMGLADNAEAEITVTVHAETRVVHQPDTRSPPPTFGEIVMDKFDTLTIYNAMVACMEEEERVGDTRILDEDLNCIPPPPPAPADPPPEFLDGGSGEYPADLCARLGGDVKFVSGQGVCQNIDTSGTFCFMGAPEVFPCRGLYKSVTRCNHFNRPGKNPFACGRNCPEGQFACGSKCWSGEISQTGRIPYVVPDNDYTSGHIGDVFRVAATLRAGEARFSLSSSIFTVGAADGTLATVGISAPLAEGAEYAATLRADFACNGLSNTPAHAEWAFTVTALATLATIYFESGGTVGGALTVNGIGQLSIEIDRYSRTMRIDRDGRLSFTGGWPAVGSVLYILAKVTSPEIAGDWDLDFLVHFRHPFDADLGPNHCRVPADSDYRALRRNACPTVAVNDYCPALDDDLLNALETKGVRGDSDFCAALRSGANVNAPNPERDYPYPMAAAAKGGSVARGRTLTLHGASVVNSQHGDALNYAALAGSAEFAEWLIVTVGASINRKSGADNQYAPVLMLGMRDLSASGDSATIARLLTAYNVSADAESDFVADGATLPYRYISHLTDPGGEPDHHSLLPLLEHGMDPHYPHPGGEDEGLRPLSRALKYNYAKVVSVLLVDGGDLVDPSLPDLNNDDPEKRTPPIFRARTPEMMDLLAAAGASLNASIKVDGSRAYVTAVDSLIIDFLESDPESKDAMTISLAIDRLRELGGECRFPSQFAQADPRFAALCGITDGESSSSGDASGQGVSGEGVCDSPWALNLGDSGFYASLCSLECPAERESGEWYCWGFADIYDDSGELNSSALENIRSQCETQAASSESGLSCR